MDAPETVASASPGAIHSHAQGASVIQVETSRLLPWFIVCGMLAGFACALSIFTLWQCWITERDERALFIAVQDQNALMLREGIKLPTDEIYGPANNLEYRMKGDGHGRDRVSDPAKRNSSVQRNPK